MIIINRLWLWAYFLLGGMFFLIVYLIIAEIKNSRKFGMVDGVKLAKRLREAGQGKVKTGQPQAPAQGQSSQKKRLIRRKEE